MHHNIRSANLLPDFKFNAKLADFDCSIKVGDNLDCGIEPFAKLLGEKAGQKYGIDGKAGSRTETFAIRSVFYFLMLSHDPYGNKWFGECHGRTFVALFQSKELPLYTKLIFDTIIGRYWVANLRSVKCPSKEIM